MEATIHTNMGDIRLELFPEQAPNTVKNFTSLAKGEREWTDPSTGQQTSRPLDDGPGYQFNDEIHPDLNFDKPYLLAMANAGKRMGKGTNGSQFFITVAPTPWLLGNHTIFGEVIDDESKRVVDAIATTRTGRGDRPVDDVVISSIDIVD